MLASAGATLALSFPLAGCLTAVGPVYSWPEERGLKTIMLSTDLGTFP